MGSLLPSIRSSIEHNGPMSISTYMSALLTSKSTGYYMKKDVFGREGDFITAPEISQLFGEMIGLNIINKLSTEIRKDRPFHIIELGPGRGTLMNDILRTFSSFPSFFENIQKCSLVEMSPSLKEIQLKNLLRWSTTIDIGWSDYVEELDVQSEAIPIVIAQEFFDAIPIHVFKKTYDSWKELKVSSNFCLVEQTSALTELLKLEYSFPKYPNNETLELSPSSWGICHHIRRIFDKCKRGEGIIIDYGNFRPAKSSLRAIYKHKFCSIFEHMGDADLSADVDFQSLMHYLGPNNKYNFMTQGQFLVSNGIRKRAEMLVASDKSDVDKAIERLVSKDQMGSIYKILEFSRK